MKLGIVLVCLVGAVEICKALHDITGSALASVEARPVFGRCTDNQISVMLREMADAPPITVGITISSSAQQGNCRVLHQGKSWLGCRYFMGRVYSLTPYIMGGGGRGGGQKHVCITYIPPFLRAVELAVKKSSHTISRIAVIALSSGDPVGKFAVPQESSGRPLASHQDCQPGQCVGPDVRARKGLSIT